jgi:hypothetical protein
MKKTLTTHDVANELHSDKNAAWSWAGALALAEYLEELEASTGEEMEMDVVAIRCDFSEHESLGAWALDYFGGESYALEKLALESLEDAEEAIRDYIQDHGTLLELEGGVIVSSF